MYATEHNMNDAAENAAVNIIIIIIKLYLYSTFHAKECSSKCFNIRRSIYNTAKK